MFSKSKYLVGQVHIDGTTALMALVFPENFPHAVAAHAFLPGSIVSGGFCHYEDDDVRVYGESISMKVKSRPDQDMILLGRALSHPKYIVDTF